MSYWVSMEEVLRLARGAWEERGIAGAGRDEPTMIPIGEASLGFVLRSGREEATKHCCLWAWASHSNPFKLYYVSIVTLSKRPTNGPPTTRVHTTSVTTSSTSKSGRVFARETDSSPVTGVALAKQR
jgi:hypothetical protein